MLLRVVSHLPHAQPFVVVSADGRVLAANRPLMELVGCGPKDLIGAVWSSMLPAWAGHGERGPHRGVECFEGRLLWPRRPGRPPWVHVVADPMGEGADAGAYALFLTLLPRDGLAEIGAGHRRRLAPAPEPQPTVA